MLIDEDAFVVLNMGAANLSNTEQWYKLTWRYHGIMIVRSRFGVQLVSPQ